MGIPAAGSPRQPSAGCPSFQQGNYDGPMATWRDGPEYAPQQRPEAFVEPPAGPLDTPATPADPSAGAPAEQPSFTAPDAPAPDLTTLIPASAGPGRDPRQAFEVVTSTMTSSTGTAWASAHSSPGGTAPAWNPQQPLTSASTPIVATLPQQRAVAPGAQVNPTPFPAPGTPQWFAPPDPDQRFQAPAQVSLPAVWRAVTPAVVITLGLGAVLNSLSIVLLVVAFGLASRIAYRRKQVRICFGVAGGLVGLVWLWTFVVNDFYLDWAWGAASTTAQLCCLGLIFALGLVVALALTRGERPDSRP